MRGDTFIVLIVLFVLATAVSPVSGVEYVIGDAKEPITKGDPDATYVGADRCKGCHPEAYADWSNTGHKYKLNTPEDILAVRPDLPLLEGYEWDDILYVIGGWGWKARYIGRDGYIITKYKDGTTHEMNQYNFADGSWSSYHPGEEKKYNCQKCHNTGANYEQGDHMDLTGMEGDWEFNGVQCEACHGPGSEHIAQGGGVGVAILLDKTTELCSKCHVRGTGNNPPFSGGFIRHHEQYQELQGSKMNTLNCITCHDPHKPVHVGATNDIEGFGIRVECEVCHGAIATDFAKSTMGKEGVGCVDCHMPKMTKSGAAESTYVGDVRTHIFEINTDPAAEASAVFPDGNEYATGYLTLDFACLSCHDDKDKTWGATYTEGIHSLVMEMEAHAEPATQTPEPGGGICGPTAILLIAGIPAAIYRRRRR